jgi:UDP:flavonoid glycosyltransferase YjiC (YdhE family)
MRVLFASTANAGHFRPLVPFVQAAQRAGHEVLVAGHAGAGPPARRAGLPFRAVRGPEAEDLRRFRAGQAGLSVQKAMARALSQLYVRLYAGAALRDMLATIEEWRPDVVVRESAEFSALIAAERAGVPHARVGIGLSTQLELQMLPLAEPALAELGASVGVAGELGRRAAEALCLTTAPPSLDDPGASGSGHVLRFREGEDERGVAAPGGWGDPAAPLVYLSFGTEVPSAERDCFPWLYRAAVEALEGTDARVLVTVGNERDPAELGALPPSVRAERWVSQAALMPHIAAMIGHGGAGSTLAALAAGVPLALVPMFADQPFNAERVARVGAAIAVEPDPESLAGLGEALDELLSVTRYRQRAGALATEIAGLPHIDGAPHALEARYLASIH